MSSVQLYIEDQLIDLDPSTNVGLTFQLNDIAELKDRQSTFSNQFKALHTENNHAIFGYAHRVQSLTQIPYNRVNCILVVGGIQHAGYVIVETGATAYLLRFLTGNAEFVKAIEGKKLSDLDLSAYDITWDYTNMVAKYGSTTSPTFFIIDDGTLPTGTRVVDVRRQFPQMYCKDIFAEIVAQAGFSKSGSLLTVPPFLNHILPFTNSEPKAPAADSGVYAAPSVVTQVYINPGDSYQIVYDSETTDVNNEWDNVGPDTNYQPVSDKYVQIKTRCAFHYQFMTGIAGDTFYVEIVRERAGVLTITPITSVGFSVGGSFLWDPYDSGLIKVKTIDKYYVRVRNASQSVLRLTVNPTFLIFGTAIIIGNPKIPMSFGNLWTVENNLPDMSQIDFIKMILNQYAVIMETDGLTRNVRFETMRSVAENKTNAIPIDEYIDHANPPEKQSHANGYAQKNWMRYKEDDNVPAGEGDSFIQINDYSLPTEKELFTLPVAASISSIKLDGLFIWQVLRVKDGDEITPQPRILQTISDTVLASDKITLTDGTSSVDTEDFHYTSFDHANENDLGFANLIEEYYPDVSAMLNNFCKLTIAMNYDAAFISSLDMMVPLYSAVYSSYFYNNKISNFQGDRPAKNELIRL